MFISTKSSTSTSEKIPLTGAFNKNENSNETEDTLKDKSYSPIIHAPFGTKQKKRPPVVHSPVIKKAEKMVDEPAKPENKVTPFEKVFPSKTEVVKPMLKPTETTEEVQKTTKQASVSQKQITLLDGTPIPDNEVQLLRSIVCKWKQYCNKRKDTDGNASQFRKGPAPLDEGGKTKKKFVIRCSHGTLDSDVESIDSDDEHADQLKETFASSKGLLLYFAKLAVTKDEKEGIDLKFVNSLINGGADVNFTDRYGQTVLHEVSRAWNTDVAKFLISKGANINKGDKYGRTALHLSAAVGYVDMIEFLVKNGGNIHCQTKGEKQTPIHYASQNNSVASIKILTALGANIADRDYKQRTPLHIAAENGRIEAARFLLEMGAPAAVYDKEGNSCLSLMVEKMPAVALEALEQFYTVDQALRKKYYYLNYLEKRLSPDEEEQIAISQLRKSERKKKLEERKLKRKNEKPKDELNLAKSTLEVIVEFSEFDLIMHPAIQNLIEVRWNLFAKRSCQFNVFLNILYALLWSLLGLLIPRNHNYYIPLSNNWWRIVLEVAGIGMTIYFMVTQYLEARYVFKRHKLFKTWHTSQVVEDLQYCHPKWEEEQRYLDQEIERIKRGKSGSYFTDAWNIIDWTIYLAIWVVIITRIMVMTWDDDTIKVYHIRIFAMSLILVWLRVLKACRAFQALGPFITLLGYVVDDTLKFGFLFFDFFIPYVCAFWMLFGDTENANIVRKKGIGNPDDWERLNDLVYSVFQITILGNFSWDALTAVDKLMAQVLVGTYITVSSIVCLNLYIALMSDTFARVYQNAKANANLQRSNYIISAERVLSKKRAIQVNRYLSEDCAPLEIYAADEEGKNKGNPGNRIYDKINRHTDTLVDGLKDMIKTLEKQIKKQQSENKGYGSKSSVSSSDMKQWQKEQQKQINGLSKSIQELREQQENMFEFLKTNLKTEETYQYSYR